MHIPGYPGPQPSIVKVRSRIFAIQRRSSNENIWKSIVSALATIASAVVESVFSPLTGIPATASDVRDPKQTRACASLIDMAEEQKNVRVWGGVYYRFAIRTSEEMGRKVAAYMIENSLKPAR